MPRPVLPRTLAVALTSAVLVAVPVAASAADGGSDQPTVEVSGTLLQVPAEKDSGRTTPGYGLQLASGDIVPVEADFATDPAPNSRFRGTLAVPQRIQSTLAGRGVDLADGDSVPASSALGRRALALVDASGATMVVERSTVSAPAAAAAPVGGTTHRLLLAAPDNVGTETDTDAEIMQTARAGASYWEGQAEGAIADDEVSATVVHYDTEYGTADNSCGLGEDTAVFFNMVDEARALFPDRNHNTDQVLIAVPPSCSTDGALGIGTIGTGFESGGDLISTTDDDYEVGSLAHEMGHNYGFQHSNVVCGDDCYDEYAGIYEVMGYGVPGANQLTALGTVYRLLNGVEDAGEVLDVAPGNEPVTASISSRSTTDGARSIAVEDPVDGYTYFLDYRAGGGQDAGAAYATSGGLQLSGLDYVFRPGIVVTRPYGIVDEANNLQGTGGSEVVPNGTTTAFVPGQTWRSPSGALAVHVDTIGAGSATVTVRTAIPTAPGPRIAGVIRVGSRITAVPGTWTSGTTFTYQWKVDGRTVSTASSYVVPAAYRGHRVALTVTGSNPRFAPTSRSTGTATIGYGALTAATPRVLGTAKVGRRLVVSRGSWTSGTSLSQTWYVGGRAVSHATSLRLAKSAKGKRVVVKVTGRKAGYTTLTRSAPATAPVRR